MSGNTSLTRLVADVSLARKKGAHVADLLRHIQDALAPRPARLDAVVVLQKAFGLTMMDARVAGRWRGWGNGPDGISDSELEHSLGPKLGTAAPTEKRPAPDISRYAHFWDGSEPGWVLFGSRSFGPFNALTSMGVIIEDNDEFTAVVEEMQKHLVPVIRSLKELEAYRERLAARAPNP